MKLALAAVLALLVAAPAHAAVTARGSIEQAYVTGAKKGERLRLLSPAGKVLASAPADRLGSRVFRDLTPRKGYRVRHRGGTTKAFAVLKAGANPPASFYKKLKLKPGLNYVKVRDGVELAMTVRLPSGKSIEDAPFPTVIEYSGYQVAAPNDLLGSLVSGKSDPLAPAAGTVVGSAIAPLLGFATVSVQMRGSGCSGGAFDLFDLATTYDGYDAIEAVAAQRWVKGGKVGMVGISFSGIFQLFTAGTRPPHLAAIAPMSVTDDLYAATGFPGGIRNVGFASSWVQERFDDAQPAPGGGQPWAKALVKAGDAHCRANQRLRLQSRDVPNLLERRDFKDPAIYARRSPSDWMGRITVPTFLAGQFQDEQTGGHFASSLHLLARNPRTWLTLQNGVHADSLGPDVITRWVEFLKLYVANEVPEIPQSVLGLSGALYNVLASSPASPVQQSRFAGQTDVAAARAAFERDPRVRLVMENGAGPAGVGALGGAWELSYGAWPIREAAPTTWFLGAGGALDPAAPAEASSASYVADPLARPRQTLPGSGETDAWKAQPPYDWKPVVGGKGLGWVTPALERDVVVAGTGSLDLRLTASQDDTDLQVTVSEVRPDGAETYVQNGWLRASHRKLDAARSTALMPVPTHRQGDAARVPRTTPVEVRVPIFAAAHAFRAGSRIRVTVQAPNGDRPRWRFGSIDTGRTTVTVALGGATPSKLVLPVVAGAVAGAPLPPATALRGQPSRAYVPASNGG